MTEDEMVGRHHRLNGHEFVRILGDSEGQGSLACCSPWGPKESDPGEQLNNKESKYFSLCRPDGLCFSCLTQLLCPKSRHQQHSKKSA